VQRHVAALWPECLQLLRLERPRDPSRLDQLERRIAGQVQRLQELQLVVEVVLEPEHHARVRFQRLLEEPVAPLERLQQRPLRSPAAVAQEPRPHCPQLGRWHVRHRPLVEHVLPREHRAAKRCLPQRVAGALAVRHVEELPEPRVAPAAREDAAPQVQWSSESQAHPTTRASSSRTRRRLAIRSSISSSFWATRVRHGFVCPADVGETGVLGDLLEREAEPLRLLHGLHEPDCLLVVVAVPVDPAQWLVEQAPPLVVAERLDVHPGASGDLSDPHPDAIVDPYRGTDVKRGRLEP